MNLVDVSQFKSKNTVSSRSAIWPSKHLSFTKTGDKGDIAQWAILRTSSMTKLKEPFGGVALNPEAKNVVVMENDHSAALLISHLPEVLFD